MPQAGPAIAAFVKGVGAAISAATAAVPGGAATLAAGAALSSIAYTSYSTKKAEADARKEGSRAPRDITVRSAVEPARIIYGTARTSGPVVYTNTAPTPGTSDNSTLWTVISLCQHEIDDITEIWLDGDKILSSAIDWAGTGGVTSGKYGPIGGNEVTNFYRRLGTNTQTHVTELAAAFSDWTSDYDGRGVAYIVSAFELGTATGEGVWAQGAPQNIRAVVKGKKVYDPRKDSTQTGGSGAHRLADPTTWEWSDNPALCLADYLFDARLGMGAEGITYNEIDWDLVFAAANACDTLVTTPDGNQKRFTCNGALSTGETYAENIKQLLSSMSGQITWSGGKFRIRAAAYEAPTYTFTGDDVIGDVQIQPERTRTQRYNKIRGTFIDPDSDYVATEFIPVENTSYKNTRDGGQTLSQEIRLPFTNDEYMAQRIAFKQLNLNNQQLRCIVPFNWKAMKVAVGDRIQLSIDELSWSNKVFRVDGWSFSPDSGFNLELQEDSSSAYADPLLAEYSTRTLAGVVSFADQAVSAPSGLQATSEEEAVLLEWDPPPRPSGYDEVVIYASATSAWSGASEIGRTRGNTFRHELTRGTARYYWVRAVDVDGRESIRDPDSDTSSITATAGQIATSQLNDDASFADTADWPQVTGVGRPEDNATVGATVGTDLYDTDGTTVLGQTDVLNSILEQDILRVELEGETILNLETGLEVDIQNLGDVAIFVNESNSTIQGNIDLLEGNIQNLTSLIGDVTAGVGDVYLQDSEPVAGVGGIPNPIPDGSRWYDTDDNNAPYYWNGAAWVSLLDPRIGQNAAAVTALQTRMTTAEGDIDTNTADIATNSSAITANASAISTLDTTVVSQGNSITAISADITDLETALEDEGGNFSTTSNAVTVLQSRVTQTETDITSNSTSITTLTNNLSTTNTNVSTNASAISALDTRVTSAEGSISSQATDITSLQSDLSSAESDITTNASAITALTTRVTSAEGNITINSSDITTLSSDLSTAQADIVTNAGAISTAQTDISANSTAISGLDTRVTTVEGLVTSEAQSTTILTTRLDFLQRVEDEAGPDPLELEDDALLDLETLDDVTSATSSAIDTLSSRTTETESGLVSQASRITSLESTVDDPTTGVSANASGLSSLTTRVETTESSITSISADVTTLQSGLTTAEGDISTNASAISSLGTRVTAAEGSIVSNASDITTLQSSLTTTNSNVSTNASAISGLDTRVTTAEGSISSNASDISTLESTVNDPTTGVAANATAISSLSTRVTATESSITVNASDISTLESSLTTTNSNVTGNATAISGLDTRVTAAEGSITSQASDITSLQSSLSTTNSNVTTNATAISGLDTRVTSAEGSITSIASDVTTLTTTVGSNTTSISTNASSINGIEANYTVKIDANNRISGFGLLSTTAGATPFSEFVIIADKFSVVDPTSTADTPIVPFQISGGKAQFTSDVEINGDLVVAGTINANRLAIDGVTLDTSGSNLIIANGGVGTTQVGTRAITNTARADMASNTNYSTSWITLASLTGQSFDDGDIAEISWGLRAHPEASGAPYIAIRLYVRVSNTDKLYHYFIGDVSYDTTNWAQIQQALFASTFQYAIDTTNSDWKFYLQAATNTNGTFPRSFRAPGTYIQAVRLKR
jgi:predicted  nucleic acid-binding Zn-ribbon protein